MHDEVDSAPPAPETPAPAPSAPERIWSVYAVTALLLLGMVALAALVLGELAFAPEPVPMLSLFLLGSGVSVAWIGAVTLGVGLLSPVPIAARLGWMPARLPVSGWILAIVGGLALSQGIDLALTLAGTGRGQALDFMIDVLSRARGVDLVAAVLVVGFGAGTAEELFFRGYAQRRLVARYGAPVGIAIAAALFALAHGDPRHAAFAFAFGLYAGGIARWSDSTRPAVAIHVTNNVVSVLTIAGGIDAFAASAPRPLLMLGCAGLLATALACALAVRRQAARWTSTRILG